MRYFLLKREKNIKHPFALYRNLLFTNFSLSLCLSSFCFNSKDNSIAFFMSSSSCCISPKSSKSSKLLDVASSCAFYFLLIISAWEEASNFPIVLPIFDWSGFTSVENESMCYLAKNLNPYTLEITSCFRHTRVYRLWFWGDFSKYLFILR